jgi:MFS family permease
MFAALRQRNFALLWSGGLVSQIGDVVLFVALPFYVYERTGSALATGATFMASTLPRILFGSVAGVFVDRWDRRRTMIAADLLRAALVLALLAVALYGWIWAVYLVAFLEATVSRFFSPAKGALVPRLVEECHLTGANALNGLSNNLGIVIGPAFGGLLVGALGLPGVVLVDSASYLVSAALLLLIAVPAAPRAALPGPAGPGSPPGPAARGTAAGAAWAAWVRIWRDWRAGVRLVRRTRWLGALLIAAAFALFGDGVLAVLFVPFVRQVLAGDAQAYGALVTARGLGSVAGTLLVGTAGGMLSAHRLFALALGATGLELVVMANVPAFPVATAAAALMGACIMGWAISMQTLVQRGVADQYRGRIFATLDTTNSLAGLAGMGLAGIGADRLGTVPLLTLAGAATLAAGVLASVLLPGTPGAGTEPSAATSAEAPAPG